jgi:hypothetical protein
LALSRQCARGGAVDRGKVAAWAAENNPKSDGAPEMSIAARRKLIRQLRHHVGAAAEALACQPRWRVPVTIISISRLPHFEHTGRRRQSRTLVSAPCCWACSGRALMGCPPENSGSQETPRWRGMDSNFQFPDIVEGSFFGRSQRGSVAEPKFCRLAAGGSRIRTISPAEDARYPDDVGSRSRRLFHRREASRAEMRPAR